MTCIRIIVTLCAALLTSPISALAEPEHGNRSLELGFGILAPVNSLQELLTRPNNGVSLVKSTDLLDFGSGPRLSMAYRQTLAKDSSLLIGLIASRSTGQAPLLIGATNEAFPGTYDDGYSLGAGWTVDTGVETRMTLARIGHEWAIDGRWRLSAGLQGGSASQDLTGILITDTGVLGRRIASRSENRMLGVFWGIDHYTPLNGVLGLRLSASLGVFRNDFAYDYANQSLIVGSGTSQFVTGAARGTATSQHLSMRLEQSLPDGNMVSLEIGYDGLNGIGNGADTLLDPAGNRTSASIGHDRIGATYLSIGYAMHF